MSIRDSDLLQFLSKKQILSFNQSNSKINIWEGAVRSGKTYISLLRFLTAVSEGPPGEYCIISRTYDTFKRNLLPQILSLIGVKDLQIYKGNREIVLWEKTIHIIGADDERAEAKIRGATFVGAYVDEISIIPEGVFKMLISRCAMHDSMIFGTTNPDSPYHWLKKDFLENNEDVTAFHFTLDDNPMMEQKDREYLRRQYKGLWYQRFIEGKWVQAEGTVYDSFDEKIHVISHAPSYTAKYIVGIDYGTTNPCAFALIGIDRRKMPHFWVEDEYYYDSKIHQRQKTDYEYGKDLEKFLIGKNPVAIYIDPSAVSFKTELHKQGFSNIFEAENEVLDGIRFVSSLLTNETLKITRKCLNFIKEIQSYVWDHKSILLGVDRPKKENDHILDAARYALFSHLHGKDYSRLSSEEIDQNWRQSMGIQPNIPDVFIDPGSYRPNHMPF